MSRPDNNGTDPHEDPLPLSRALQLLTATVKPVKELESLPLRACIHRTLAEPLTADRDVPPHDNAAVDGYAVFHEDLEPETETRLPVVGRIAAGHPHEPRARRGQALRIFTGAPISDGPDTVIMQETCQFEGNDVIIPAGIGRGANLRLRGEDIREGQSILKPGIRLRAQEIGVAASIGRARLSVRRQPRAAVFSTGDEVTDPGVEAPAGCIYDANRYTIMTLLEGVGCAVTDLGILPDRLETIHEALGGAATDHDLVITSGGVSLGEEDYVKEAVERLGSLQLWRIAIKPGRPIAMGRIGPALFIGLPGNPVAAMVTFMRIARPAVLLLSGRTEITPTFFKVRAGFAHAKKLGRREWLRVRLLPSVEGGPYVTKHPSEGSGILTSMVESDGLVELPEDAGPVSEGDLVDFLPFSEVDS